MDLLAFRTNVPMTIAGEMDEAINRENPEYIGAISEEEGVRHYYVAGLDLGLLRDAGITSENDLSQLHSMSQQGTIQVIRFESQSDRVGVFLTDAMENTLSNNRILEPLVMNNWRIFEIENPTSSTPYDGRLIDTGALVHFSELKEWFVETTKNGFRTRSQKELTEDSVRISTIAADKARVLLADGGDTLELEVKAERTEKDEANDLANKYATNTKLGNLLANAPAFQSKKSKENTEAEVEREVASSNLISELKTETLKPAQEVIESFFAKNFDIGNDLEKLFGQVDAGYIEVLQSITVPRADFEALSSQGQTKVVEKIDNIRETLLKRLKTKLKSGKKYLEEVTDAEKSTARPDVVEKHKALYLDPLAIEEKQVTEKANEERIAYHKKLDEDYEKWYQEVQTNPRGVFDAMRAKEREAKENEILDQQRDSIKDVKSTLEKAYENWLESNVYQEIYDQVRQDAIADITTFVEAAKLGLDGTLALALASAEREKTQQKIAEEAPIAEQSPAVEEAPVDNAWALEMAAKGDAQSTVQPTTEEKSVVQPTVEEKPLRFRGGLLGDD